MSRAWKTQGKLYENELIVAGLQPKEKQSVNKLDKKEKVIKSLKKQLKILVIDDPKTEELVELEKERDEFEQEALNFKAKVLQLTKEKEKLEQQVKSTTSSQVLPQISTDGITVAMSWVSLEDEEIQGLKKDNLKLQQEAKSLKKANKNLQQIIDKQK